MAIGTIDNNGNRQISIGIAGVNDNDIVIETGDVSDFSQHFLFTTAGVAEVAAALGSTFATPIALTNLQSLTPATKFAATSALNMYRFEGRYMNIRVSQSGAPALTGAILVSY